MLELTKKVFGNIMTQEIIGSEPIISWVIIFPNTFFVNSNNILLKN